MKTRLLVVEDDRSLARVLKDNLTFAGFDAECVGDGDAAIRHVRSAPPDLILLDIMLPKHDGFELCGILRKGGSIPVIMLTARAQNADKIRGLELGADDYVTKPFHVDELLARIRAVLRRSRPTVERIHLGGVVLDFRQMCAWDNGREFHLTHREFEVLRYLAEHHGHVVSRDELLREIWGYVDLPYTRSVDYTIARLRKKVEVDPHAPRYIHTAHGDGYTLTVDESAPVS